MAVTKPAWTPSSWRSSRPSTSRSGRARSAPRPRARGSRCVPPLVFAGEARQLKALARARRRGPRVPAPGRRVRGVVPRPIRGPHPREAEDHAADGGRAHLRRHAPGRQGRALRGPAREGAHVADGRGRGGRDPLLPRAHDPRRRAHAGGPDPRPRPDGAGLPPRDRDAQPPARVHEGRLRRPHARARVEPGVRRLLAGGPPLRAVRLRDRARAALHGRVRHRPLGGVAAAPGGRLDEPRGPRARLRGGAHPPRLDDRRLVRLLGAHALDRGADAPARRGARRVLLRRSATRSGSRSGRRRRPTRSSSSASGSTRRASPAA